eukprot:2298051-Prymnesium_polylepis.1
MLGPFCSRFLHVLLSAPKEGATEAWEPPLCHRPSTSKQPPTRRPSQVRQRPTRPIAQRPRSEDICAPTDACAAPACTDAPEPREPRRGGSELVRAQGRHAQRAGDAVLHPPRPPGGLHVRQGPEELGHRRAAPRAGLHLAGCGRPAGGVEVLAE